MRYRVQVKEFEDGVVLYYPQYKQLWIWRYFPGPDAETPVMCFKTLAEAKTYILEPKKHWPIVQNVDLF